MSNSILYALVARGRNVLAEYTDMGGNFTTVTRVLLAKIPQETDCRMSYVYDKHIFHYCVDTGIVFMCMCEESTKRRSAFSFLDDLMSSWRLKYAAIEQTATAFSMQEAFSPTLASLMEDYNTNRTVDTLDRVKARIDNVKEVMVENIDQLLERGEKIELLVDKTDKLNQTAFKFEKSSRRLKYNMQWQRLKFYLVVLLCVGLLSLFAAMIACGVKLDQCSSK
jgi:vesicle-associated membrane protein 7